MELLSQVVDQRFLSRPDVFRREALALTFRMLRQPYPMLALLVQNFLQGTPLEDEDPAGEAALQVQVSRRQARAIHEALTRIAGNRCSSNGNAAPDFTRQWIVTWALIRDWRTLEDSDYCTR